MREIKFRAWNNVTKTMVDLKKITPLILNMHTDGLFIPFSDGLEVMQFTGLHDKNNKEIWEGDIVTAPTCKTNKDGTFSIMEIVYEIREVKFGESRIWWGWNIGAFNADKMEVIGNIYENPELLKGGD